MIAQMRPDGTLYLKIDDGESYQVLEDNGVEIFLNSDQVAALRIELPLVIAGVLPKKCHDCRNLYCPYPSGGEYRHRAEIDPLWALNKPCWVGEQI